MTVFSDGSLCDLTAEEVVHELSAVADTEYGDTELEDLLVALGSILVSNGAGTACKDDSLGVHLLDLLDRHIVRMNLTVYVQFSYSSCDELVVLTSEVKYKDHFFFHISLLAADERSISS